MRNTRSPAEWGRPSLSVQRGRELNHTVLETSLLQNKGFVPVVKEHSHCYSFF